MHALLERGQTGGGGDSLSMVERMIFTWFAGTLDCGSVHYISTGRGDREMLLLGILIWRGGLSEWVFFWSFRGGLAAGWVPTGNIKFEMIEW